MNDMKNYDDNITQEQSSKMLIDYMLEKYEVVLNKLAITDFNASEYLRNQLELNLDKINKLRFLENEKVGNFVVEYDSEDHAIYIDFNLIKESGLKNEPNKKNYDTLFLSFQKIMLLTMSEPNSAINKGFASNMARIVVGNSGDNNPLEYHDNIFNLLAKIVDFNLLINYCYGNKVPLLADLQKKGVSSKEFEELILNAELNIQDGFTKEKRIDYAKSQKRLINMFFKKTYLTSFEINEFRELLKNNTPNSLTNDSVYNYFNAIKNSYLLSKSENLVNNQSIESRGKGMVA